MYLLNLILNLDILFLHNGYTLIGGVPTCLLKVTVREQILTCQHLGYYNKIRKKFKENIPNTDVIILSDQNDMHSFVA